MFKPLDCDDDVLLFDKTTFTVGRFKELINENFKSKFNIAVLLDGHRRSTLIVSDNLKNMSVGELSCQLADMQWNSTPQDCQTLRIGSKGWQKGKIRVQVNFNYSSNTTDAHLEFCPDEPTEPESPLDDLRQLPEYKNGLSPV